LSAHSRSARWGPALVAALALLVAAGWPRATTAQLLPVREYDIKAGYLFNFLRFVVWPDDAFRSATAPIQVDILGRDPSGGALDLILAGKTVGDRTIVVTHPLTPRAAPPGHLVFVSSTEESQLVAVLRAYANTPVLTVSDIDRFAERGGVIGLVRDGRTLRFAINRDAGEQNRLKISAQLLTLAILVETKPQSLLRSPTETPAIYHSSDGIAAGPSD
jgi:hypothetical protein